MKQGTTGLIKFKKLKRQLRLRQWEVIGILESVWKCAIANTPAGDIGQLSNEDIATEIEWDGDADSLIESLVDCGWIDRDTEFRLVLHDWSDHVPTFLKGNFAKHGRQFANQVAKQRAKQPAKHAAKEPAKHGATKSSLVNSIKVNDKAPSDSRSEQALTEFHFAIKAKGGGTWTLPLAKYDEYAETFGDVGWLDRELKKIRQWCADNPVKRKTPGGMLSFLGKWLSRANDEGPRYRRPGDVTPQEDEPEMPSKSLRSKGTGVLS